MALIGLLLGSAAYLAVRILPLRALGAALATLGRVNDAVKNKHEELLATYRTLEASRKALAASKSALMQRSTELVEAQRIARTGDWSYRLGDADVWWSPQIYELLQYDPRFFYPSREAVMEVYVGDGAAAVLASQAEVMRTGQAAGVDVKVRRGNGSVGDFVVTSKAMLDEYGKIIGFAGTIQDISERKSAEEALEQLAYYDPLTGLGNRVLFNRKLDETLAHCEQPNAEGALLLLDLDRFKEVNDSLGHSSGDELLAKVGQLISQLLEGRHFLARLGGDEFAVIVRCSAEIGDVSSLATDIVRRLSASFQLERGEVNIGVSMGIALIPRDGKTTTDLQRNADLALYCAKEKGRGRFMFFEPEMNASVQDKILLTRDLRRAVNQNTGLSAYYQPQVDIKTGRVVAFEALMRWRHPTRGMIPPSEFIALAEKSQLICDLGLWVLREAVTQTKAWIDAGETPRQIAINVSAAQIWHTDFAADVQRILEETGLPPHLLCLELTESLFADHAEGRVRAALARLKNLGVTLALDDFGTGYSSLGYLKQLPFDKLKIDRIFIHGIVGSDRAQKMMQGIVALGRGLGMSLVAEGAESTAEIAMLRNVECDLVQGFYFARPAPAAEALATAHALESEWNVVGPNRPRNADAPISAPQSAA